MMYGAIIAGALAVIAIVGVITLLAIKALNAANATADARVREQDALGKLAIAVSNEAQQKARADRQEERANGLDAELEAVALDGDAAGARERVLRRLERKAGGDADPAPDHGARGVPVGKPDPAVARDDPDRLLAPGE